MSWTRVDDNFPWHRKLEPLMGSPRLWADAVALLVAIWCDCTKRQTNGHISGHRIDQLTPIKRTLKRTLNELVRYGFLDKDGDNYVVHDYLEYNGSKEERAEKLRLKRERQRRWREKQKANVDADVDGLQTRRGDALGDAAPQPQPQPLNLSLKGGELAKTANKGEPDNAAHPPPDSESMGPPDWRQSPVTWSSVYLCLQELTGFMGDAGYHKQHFESIARQCSQTKDPVGSLEKVVLLKKSEAEKSGRRVEPKWLAVDFDRLLNSNGKKRDLSQDEDYQDLLRQKSDTENDLKFEQSMCNEKGIAHYSKKLEDINKQIEQYKQGAV